MSEVFDLKIYKEAKDFFEISEKVKPGSTTVRELYESFDQWNQSNRHLTENVNNTPRKPRRNFPKV